MDMVSEEMAKTWLEQGKKEFAVSLYRKGELSADAAAEELGMTVEAFLKLAQKQSGN